MDFYKTRSLITVFQVACDGVHIVLQAHLLHLLGDLCLTSLVALCPQGWS